MANVIRIANAKTYFIIGMFLIVIAGVTYSAVFPAIKNHEWVKVIVFAALLFGVRDYRLTNITGLEYSEMGRMGPRHFLVFNNGDIYDIVSRKSAEKIEEYIHKRRV